MATKTTGLIHIYCGDGKGKTTAGMGLCARAAGHGYKVLIYQFLKDNGTSERKLFAGVENITCMPGLDEEKFSFQMTEDEKRQRREFYAKQLDAIAQSVREGQYDVLFLDEAIYAVGAGLLAQDDLTRFLDEKPERLEVILTGQNPGEALLGRADYVSEICMKKHPFQCGQPARDGIER